MTELVWRVIPSHPCYEASNKGHIFSTISERILTPYPNHKGYLEVRLTTGHKKSRLLKVHRLVLEAFVGPCPLDHEGAHLDGSKTNNELSNLQWKTPAQNQADRILHETSNRGKQNGMYKHGRYTQAH